MKSFGFILLVLTGLLIAGCGRLPVGAAAPPPAATDLATAPEPSVTLSPGWTATAMLPTLTPTPLPVFTPTSVSTLTPTQIAGPAAKLSTAAPPTDAAPTPAPAAVTIDPAATASSPIVTPTPAPDQSSAAAPAAPAAVPAGCEDKAAFYTDVTIPDGTMFRQGTKFTKTWQLQNAGTCAWGPSYLLVSAEGDLMSGPQSMPMPAVAPGQIFTLSVDLIAPSNGGTYQGNWVFQRPDGSRFGVNSGGIDSIWVKITVSYAVIDPGTGAAAAPATCAAVSNADYITQELVLINAARTNAGLGPLTLQPQLSAAAQVHSVDMACSSRLDHTGTDGSTWYTRVKAQGYDNAFASENIFAGSPDFGGDPPGAFDWWWKSKIHHDNLMNPKITQIGIGYAFVASSQYGGYYTLDFGLPKG